ncbi:MAG: disulfide bond formation protein DsbA [Alphaproteobacteria bacterium]|nr:disulfide bond formation protein DsbA [Alphaproteobacteria bacterium]
MSAPAHRIAIDFFADVSCPWCYVGWEALKRAAEARPGLSVSLAWRNFLLNPDMPREGYDARDYFQKKFDPERLKATHAALMAAADAAGVPLNLDKRTRIPNTIDAHRVIHWAAGQGLAEAAIDGIFAAHWVEGRDIGDAGVLVDVAREIDLDPELVGRLLSGDADRDAILALHAKAVQFGVSGVPVTILNGAALVMGAETPEKYGRALDAAAGAH